MSNNIVKSILSSSIGNVLEWYEYTLYAYFATVIGKLYFPMEDHFIAMLMTFATFAIGLLARPIGGIIFGYMGDRFSRKQTLMFTMLLMSIPTVLIGCLPTYAQIGIAAPILLVLLRIMQGIALGGEFGTSCVYLFESVPVNKRGFFGSIALTGVGLGLVLSSCTIYIVESFASEEAIYAYAWRLPFFISVAGSLIVFYMRKTLLETDDFMIAKKTNSLVANPLKEMFKNHKATLLSLFAIFLTTQVSFFVVFIYGKTMMIDFLQFPSAKAGQFILFTVMSYTVSTVIFGYLSDKIDKKIIILLGTIGIFCAAIPFINALKEGEAINILSMTIAMGALIGMTEGTLNPLVAGSFPTNIRATSVAFCWNFTAVAFGGVAPILSMWLIENAGGVDAVAYYLMGVCVVSIVSLLWALVTKSLTREETRLQRQTAG
ncbi:MAG: MFS transporter [Proteobacteria bacterium]|nr:MFS transporter [Pseudomonadota bacterium]